MITSISIHALVKRATYRTILCSARAIISIHALVKRATEKPFQFLGRINISIHALVKRATYKLSKEEMAKGDFNPRPREEGDGKLGCYIAVAE